MSHSTDYCHGSNPWSQLIYTRKRKPISSILLSNYDIILCSFLKRAAKVLFTIFMECPIVNLNCPFSSIRWTIPNWRNKLMVRGDSNLAGIFQQYHNKLYLRLRLLQETMRRVREPVKLKISWSYKLKFRMNQNHFLLISCFGSRLPSFYGFLCVHNFKFLHSSHTFCICSFHLSVFCRIVWPKTVFLTNKNALGAWTFRNQKMSVSICTTIINSYYFHYAKNYWSTLYKKCMKTVNCADANKMQA